MAPSRAECVNVVAAGDEPAAEARRALTRDMWRGRLRGVQRNVEVWQALLSVRTLVLPMHQDTHTWLKFASLCRKSSRPKCASTPPCLLTMKDQEYMETVLIIMIGYGELAGKCRLNTSVKRNVDQQAHHTTTERVGALQAEPAHAAAAAGLRPAGGAAGAAGLRPRQRQAGHHVRLCEAPVAVQRPPRRAQQACLALNPES